MNDVIQLLENEPKLMQIIAHMDHNGLKKSLAEDYKMTYLDS